ncbi:MAG: DUF4292 domain-containing protein [Bacteroidaceae bacterium]
MKIRELFMLMLVLSLASCSGVKQAVRTESTIKTSDLLYHLVKSTPATGGISSKVKFNVVFGTANYSLSGSFKIRQNEALQLSIQVPFLGTEAVRVEATPQTLLIIDRIHKKYVQEDMKSLKEKFATNLDFYALQALFVGDIFRPGISNMSIAQMREMKLIGSSEPNTSVLSHEEGNLSYFFRVNNTTAKLALTEVKKTSTAFSTLWKYDNRVTIQGQEYPTLIHASFEGITKEIALDMELSKLTEIGTWKPDTSVSSKYEKIELKDIMKMFSTL